MARDVANAGRLKPEGRDRSRQDMLLVASGAVSKYDIVRRGAPSGTGSLAARANNSSIPDVLGPLYMATADAPSGLSFLGVLRGVIKDVDTSAQAVNDPVWLGLTGGVVFTNDGGARRIGYVSKVGVAGVGEIQFDGSPPAAGAHIKAVQGEIANGVSTATITAATLGINLGGKPVVAMLNEADATFLRVRTAHWNVNDLVLTGEGNTTAARDFTALIVVG